MIALTFLPPPSLSQLRRALPPPHAVRVASTWDDLIAATRAREGDVVVVDPCTAGVRNIGDRLLDLSDACVSAPGISVVGYVSVTAAAIHAVHRLVRCFDAEIVVRGVDDGVDALAATLHRSLAAASAEPLLASARWFAPVPSDIARALALLFRRPDKVRSVDDLASAASTTRRTLDRWLARAGLAPARTLLGCARVSAAFHLMTRGKVRAANAAALLGYPSARALARELHRLTGWAPSAIPNHVTQAAFVEAIRSRLYRNARADSGSY